MGITPLFKAIGIGVFAMAFASQATAQSASDTRQYLNGFCLSKSLFFYSGTIYYQRDSNGTYRMTDMRRVRPQSVISGSASLGFTCNGLCRSTRTRLAGPGRTYTSTGSLTLRTGLSAVQRGKCRRALVHLATRNGATRISRDMF